LLQRYGFWGRREKFEMFKKFGMFEMLIEMNIDGRRVEAGRIIIFLS
jgi:hypothetical protein